MQNLDLAPHPQESGTEERHHRPGQARFESRQRSRVGAVMERLRGRVVFQGPKRRGGRLRGERRARDGGHGRPSHRTRRPRATATAAAPPRKASSSTPTASGEPTLFDLAGRAVAHQPREPAARNSGRRAFTTNLNATAYHVKGSVGRTTTVDGSVTLAESTIAGGTILSGTTGEFATTSGPGKAGLQSLTYGGARRGPGHEPAKVGEAFQIVAWPSRSTTAASTPRST